MLTNLLFSSTSAYSDLTKAGSDDPPGSEAPETKEIFEGFINFYFS